MKTVHRYDGEGNFIETVTVRESSKSLPPKNAKPPKPFTAFGKFIQVILGLAFGTGAYQFAKACMAYESEHGPELFAGDFYARLIGDAVVFALLAWLTYRCLRNAAEKN